VHHAATTNVHTDVSNSATEEEDKIAGAQIRS
jgi:hypothetical protein